MQEIVYELNIYHFSKIDLKEELLKRGRGLG